MPFVLVNTGSTYRNTNRKMNCTFCTRGGVWIDPIQDIVYLICDSDVSINMFILYWRTQFRCIASSTTSRDQPINHSVQFFRRK